MDQIILLKKQPLVWGRLRLKGAKDRVQSKDSSPLNPPMKTMKTSFSINQMLDAPNRGRVVGNPHDEDIAGQW